MRVVPRCRRPVGIPKARWWSPERHGKNKALEVRNGRPKEITKAFCGGQEPIWLKMAIAVSSKLLIFVRFDLPSANYTFRGQTAPVDHIKP